MICQLVFLLPSLSPVPHPLASIETYPDAGDNNWNSIFSDSIKTRVEINDYDLLTLERSYRGKWSGMEDVQLKGFQVISPATEGIVLLPISRRQCQ